MIAFVLIVAPVSWRSGSNPATTSLNIVAQRDLTLLDDLSVYYTIFTEISSVCIPFFAAMAAVRFVRSNTSPAN